MRASLRPLPLALLALFVSACAPTAPRTVEPTSPPPAGFPAYETFDASRYDVQPPRRAEIVHDVPARQMQGRVDVPGDVPPPTREPVAREVEGYRVQVFTTVERSVAERVRGEAISWWQTAARQNGAPSALEPQIAYVQPYYRVRLGGFANRAEAEAAVAFVRRRFPEAFLVPDLVTVME